MGKGTILIRYSQAKKKMSRDFHFILYTIINPKWAMDLKIRMRTIKLLEKNNGENLEKGTHAMHFRCISYYTGKC